jgi:hypothetical protein
VFCHPNPIPNESFRAKISTKTVTFKLFGNNACLSSIWNWNIYDSISAIITTYLSPPPNELYTQLIKLRWLFTDWLRRRQPRVLLPYKVSYHNDVV